MKIPNDLGIGFYATRKNGEQQMKNYLNNMTYATPYQIPYEGMLLETDKLSTSYDATALPTQCVAVPAGTGEYVDGFAYISSYMPHPLHGGANVLYPLTADIGDSGYAESYANWFDLTVAPLIPGDLVGMPVYAGENITWGSEVAAATGGYIKVAVSGDWVVAKGEWPGNNTAGTSGAVTASVRICHQYKKA